MKRTLSTVVERLKRLWGGSASDADDERAANPDSDAGPDLYECEGCGVVFISEPEECSNCGDDDFSNVGSF